MAWYEFEIGNVKGMTGDDPVDEFALALERIARAYENQFSRKPTMAELLHSFKNVIGATPEEYVSDPEGLRFAKFTIQREFEKERSYVDTSQYEGVYTDREDPGYYEVLRLGKSKKGEAVIKIPKLELNGRALICEYEIPDDSLTDEMAETLIESRILKRFLLDDYRDEADEILFRNLKTNYERRKPYPK